MLDQTETITLIREYFERAGLPGLPKHVQLHNAVVAAIRAGVLKGGDRLPGERDLCGKINVSLGTIQKALSRLALEGFVTREHGRGTFVAAPKRSFAEPWHFRFLSPDTGMLLPVYSRVTDRRLLKSEGPWSAALGRDAQGYVRITRLINIADAFTCWSEMYLRADRFSRLLSMPAGRFENVNLKQVLAAEFDAPTLAANQTVRVTLFPSSIAKVLKIGPRTAGLLLQAVTFTYGHARLSFQKIFIPPTKYELEVGADVRTSTIASLK
jgi:GntR family transcriptional regulator